MAEISLTKNEFKALSSDTRVTILKSLDERNYTLSELAKKLGVAPPTAKQHTTILMQSDLIELKDEGRKWKYYSLTRKGKDLLYSKQKNTSVLIILASSLVMLAGIAMVFGLAFSITLQSAAMQNDSGTLMAGASPQIQPSPTAEKIAGKQDLGNETGFGTGQEQEGNNALMGAILVAAGAIAIIYTLKYRQST
ncbi:MAG: ArsR family transcriptional regulator [archaeon]